MNQLSLLPTDDERHEEARTRTHKSDPSTSYAAVRELVDTGELGAQQRRVFEALQAHEGRTSDEIAAEASLDRYMVARRLPDLLKLGRARQGEKRESAISGRPAVTWWVVR